MNGAEVADSRLNSLPFELANRADIGNGNDQEIEGKFAIDNLKNWDFAKTDFSDRFVEGFEEPMFIFEDSWV